MLEELVDRMPSVPGPSGRPLARPKAVLTDAAYDSRKNRVGMRKRGLKPVIPKRGREHGSGLGELRHVVERTFSWLMNQRRLRLRYEKRADIHDAFLQLACALICFQPLTSMGLC